MSAHPIADVAALCERQAAAARELFERLGAWVATTNDGALQRAFATACHRHAWHAELWEARRPSVPVNAAPTPAQLVSLRATSATDADRAAGYLADLDTLIADLGDVVARGDGELDPSTARTSNLVLADLIELRSLIAPA